MKQTSGLDWKAISGAGAALLAATLPLASETLICADPLLSVTGDDTALLGRTCDVAVAARADLAQCNVVVDQPLEIAVKGSIESTELDCVAVFHCGEDRIELLSPVAMSAARERGGPFELISDEAFWSSVIVHEMAHAAYDRVPCPLDNCVATSEYVAYVMQVRSLPEDQRELFGKTVRLSGAPTRDAINAVMLMLSPGHFATYTWRHFEERDDQCGFVGQIMDGGLYFDYERP